MTSYAGYEFKWLRGLEKVVENENVKYYVIDSNPSRAIKFDRNWDYETYHDLPYPSTQRVKYVGGHFYFLSYDLFYKTNSVFVVSCHMSDLKFYGHLAFEFYSSQFYVSNLGKKSIHIFDTSCSLLKSISLDDRPYGLAVLNGNVFAGVSLEEFKSEVHILVFKNYSITKDIIIDKCRQMNAFTLDSFGYFSLVCAIANSTNLLLYDPNGIFTNYTITESDIQDTLIDSNGRFVIFNSESLNFYF